MEQMLVTVEVAARAAGISRSAAYALIASGQWPSLKIGRARRVPVEALRAWVGRQMDESAGRRTMTDTGVDSVVGRGTSPALERGERRA